jgi:hypothetical protein
MRNALSAGVLYTCKCVHTFFTGEKEREGGREGERVKESERERKDI